MASSEASRRRSEPQRIVQRLEGESGELSGSSRGYRISAARDWRR